MMLSVLVKINVCVALRKHLNELYGSGPIIQGLILFRRNARLFHLRPTWNRNPIKCVYTINGDSLDSFYSFCDLGVTVDCVWRMM